MPLTLVTGPANAGKVALLLGRYLESIEQDPLLIVPYRSDVERVERDLLRRTPALAGGWIATFDQVFERLAREDPSARPVLSDEQRSLLLRRVVGSARLNGYGRSARFGGFADALGTAVRELEEALAAPDQLHEGHLAGLYAAYRAELERLGRWDRDGQRAFAAGRLEHSLPSWDGRPVLAYGFADLTGAEWRLLEALAGRAEVTVSLPYEPGRPAFASVERTASDLARLADGRIVELPARSAEYAHPALARLERRLFSDTSSNAAPPALEGAVRWLEGAGARGLLELVAEEVLELLRAGAPADQIAVVCPSLDRIRAPLETAFGTLGIPYALEGTARLARTSYGHALLSLLRFAWGGGGRRELYAFLRSPYSGFTRAHADFLEGRLRGRAVHTAERVEEETVRLRGQPLPALDALRAARDPLAAAGELAASMVRSAYGLQSPPVGEESRLDLRAYDAARRLLAELEGWQSLAGPLPAE
ncbi:MAG: hypothetical protein H0V40_05955, partial [Actinobacteria bacterium]|nr:hypothetical protein [Actinomycetota bacterium]